MVRGSRNGKFDNLNVELGDITNADVGTLRGETNAETLLSQSSNNTIYASENHESLPSISKAVSEAVNVFPPKLVTIVPGAHEIDSKIVVDSSARMMFLGEVRATGDFTAFDFLQNAFVGAQGVALRSNLNNGTTPGFIFRGKVRTNGVVRVNNYHGDGVVITTDKGGNPSAAGNNNASRATFSASGCDGNGVTVTRGGTTAGGPDGTLDLNAMLIELPTLSSNADDGLFVKGGFGNHFNIGVTENNAGDGVKFEGYSGNKTIDNFVRIGDSEGNSGVGIRDTPNTQRNTFEVYRLIDGEDVTALANYTTKPSNERIVSGKVNTTGPAASANDTWASNQSKTVTASFPAGGFETAPVVVTDLQPGFAGLDTTVSSVGQTSTDIALKNYSSTDRTGNNVTIHWLARAN